MPHRRGHNNRPVTGSETTYIGGQVATGLLYCTACRLESDSDADLQYLTKYKKIRNNIRKITRQKQKNEQIEIAKAAKSNPKKLWAYVKNKTVLKSSVGDLKTIDNGIEVTITDDTKKASAFCKYFSSVFTAADVSPEQRLNLKADTTELIPDTDELDT